MNAKKNHHSQVHLPGDFSVSALCVYYVIKMAKEVLAFDGA